MVREGRPGTAPVEKTTYSSRPITTERPDAGTESLIFIPEDNIYIVLFADFYVDRTDI
ncbi:MAG: hypothetical protein K6T75_06285 [Acetobacteraceae bacterium]|nr:hypothetical protein [Acetobacteraceae bacterium]